MSPCTYYAKIHFKQFSVPGISQYWKAVKSRSTGFLRPSTACSAPSWYIRRLRYLRRPAAASGAWRLWLRSTAAEGGLARCVVPLHLQNKGQGVPLALWGKEADGDRLSPSARWLDLIGACSGAIRPAASASLKERLSAPT